MKKKILILPLIALIMLLLLSIKSFAMTNPYPVDGIDGSKGEYSNCTWTVWKIVKDDLKIELPSWSSAGKWYDNAKKSGYAVGSDPEMYSIACFTSHVAYVQEVNGSKVFVREGGWGKGANRGYNERWVDSSKVNKGFIYLNPKWYNLMEKVDLGNEYYASISINDSKVIENNKSLELSSDVLDTDLSYVWDFIKQSDGSYVIRNMITNRYIDIMNFEDKDGAKVDTMTYNGSTAQKFNIYIDKAGNYYLSPLCSERVLNVTENSIDLFTYDSEKLQGFKICEIAQDVITKNLKLNQTKELKVTEQTTNTINVSWKKDVSFDGYRIYMSEDGVNFVFLKTLSKNTTVTYLKDGLTPGKTYYFRVRGYRNLYGDKKFGKYSEVLETTTKPSTPSFKSVVSNKKKQATVTYGKVNGATAYVLYISTTKKGGYTKFATVTNGKLTYTKKSLKSKTTYYFKMRVYKTVSGKNYYSAYSAVKSVKVK